MRGNFTGLGVEIDQPGSNTSELNWSHHDRLGSIISISDSSGNLKEKLAYDSWGKRRTTDGSATPDNLDGQVDNKGYTGHEMLDQLDLVHMNGRIYDPLMARFLSADPMIQDPLHSQSYNRYTYVWNNPTNLTDPTGFEAGNAGDNGLIQKEEANKKDCDLVCQDVRRKMDACHAMGGNCGMIGDTSKATGNGKDKTGTGQEQAAPLGNAAKSGDVLPSSITSVLRKFDADYADEIKFVQFLSPQSLKEASEYYSARLDATGNFGYAILTGLTSAISENPQEVGMILSMGRGQKAGVPGKDFVPGNKVFEPYTRPSGAGPTAEQRASVQGKPCVDCGVLSKNQVADHKDPLVVQHYRDGKVNVQQQRSVEAVQPHCPSCSAAQGGQLSAFSRAMKKLFGF